MKIPKIIFSKWVRWTNRTSLHNVDAPGIYIIAQFRELPTGNVDTEMQDIIYIGETCSQTLKKRWNNFHAAVFNGKNGVHSGGETCRKILKDNGVNLSVAAFPVNELNNQIRPSFIRYVERKLIWKYARKWGKTPTCNKK